MTLPLTETLNYELSLLLFYTSDIFWELIKKQNIKGRILVR